MKNSTPHSVQREKMEDEDGREYHDADGDDNECFDVLYADDSNPDNNATSTLQWLEWKFDVVPNAAGDGQTIVYGIPDFLMN